jgi:outer membrane protein OmpA-like peptidoglycan-associated protein
MMEPIRTVSRRGWMVCACAGVLWLSAGCSTPPPAPAPTEPPPAPAAVTRDAQMRALGFERVADGWESWLTGKILFESDSDVLDPETQSAAERLGRQLAELGVTQVRVEGHTDTTGSMSHNLRLSERRAAAVARALETGGLRDARIQVLGLGQAAPVNDNRTPELRQQNRRVSVVVPAW